MTNPGPQHASRPRAAAGARFVMLIAGLAVLVLTGSAIATAALAGPAPQPEAVAAPRELLPPPVISLPAPAQTAVSPAPPPLCERPEVASALAAGDDRATIAAAGGAAALRKAVATGAAACIALDDPERVWVVVNKQRPFVPIDYRPSSLTFPDGVRSLEGGAQRADAAAALSALAAAARTAGVGGIAMESGFRSYQTQRTSYGNQVAARGAEGADMVSARPGFSEHQSGLAADVVACNGGCSGLDALAASAQGAWIAEHSWEFGWIVRYEDGYTGVTGYLPEPWHLRYIGVDLAAAYHEGGWHTLEQFWGLPAAPDYLD